MPMTSSNDLASPPAASAAPPSRMAVLTATDVAVLVGIPFLIWPAWFVPERYWPALARVLSPLAVGHLSSDLETTAAVVRRTLGARLPELSGITILRQMAIEGILGFLQMLKCHRPGRWQPRVAPANFEHVDAALRAGRGALLWVAHGFHGHLGAKVAFAGAGLAVSHLSRATHGFSESRFGTRVLNRIQTAVEDRYLGERILIPSRGKAR
jgi:hypothetical protein